MAKMNRTGPNALLSGAFKHFQCFLCPAFEPQNPENRECKWFTLLLPSWPTMNRHDQVGIEANDPHTGSDKYGHHEV